MLSRSDEHLLNDAFLTGEALAAAIRDMFRANAEVRAAVGFVGSEILELVKSRGANARAVVLYCDLSMGGTNPAPLRQLLAAEPKKLRLYACAGLHAKVIWTKTAAILSSANLSANALGHGSGAPPLLIEAGWLISNPKTLQDIRSWINALPSEAIDSPKHPRLAFAETLYRSYQEVPRLVLTGPSGVGTSTKSSDPAGGLFDTANQRQLKHATVVISRTHISRDVGKTVRQMTSAGYPVNTDDLFEDYEPFTPGALIAYFDQKKSGKMVFEGFYRMRRDKWATIKKRPTPSSSTASGRSKLASKKGSTYWLQFVEAVSTIDVSASLRVQLNNAVAQYLKHHPKDDLGDLTSQFAFAELRRFMAR